MMARLLVRRVGTSVSIASRRPATATAAALAVKTTAVAAPFASAHSAFGVRLGSSLSFALLSSTGNANASIQRSRWFSSGATERPDSHAMLKRVIKLNDSGRKQEAAEVALQLERCRNEDANSETEKNIGLGFFQTGQYDKALTAFERVVEMVGPDPDPSDLFNILTSATKAGRFERAEEVFVAIKRSALPLPMPMNTMSYYYACALHEGSRNERAFELIDEIRPLYESLPCLDPHVLFMRGVNPSFLQYLDKAVSISSELKEDHDTVMWLVELDKNLKDKNKQTGQDIIWKCLFKYVDMSKYRVKPEEHDTDM